MTSKHPLEHQKSQILDASGNTRAPSMTSLVSGSVSIGAPRSVPLPAASAARSPSIATGVSSSPPGTGERRTALEGSSKERRLSFSADTAAPSKTTTKAAAGGGGGGSGGGAAVADQRLCVSVVEAEAKNVADPLFWKVKFDGHSVTSPVSNSLQWRDSFTHSLSKDTVRITLWAKKEAASVKLGRVDVAIADVRAGSVHDEWLQMVGGDNKAVEGMRVHVVVRQPHRNSSDGDELFDEEVSLTPSLSRLPLDNNAKARRMSSTPSPSPGLTLRRDTSHIAELLKDRPQATLEREKEWRKFFELPDTDLLVGDWSAAFMKGVARHGRLFVFTDHLCFQSNIFGVKTAFSIPFVDVIGIEKTVENLTPGIKIRTNQKAYNFGGIYARVKCYEQVSNIWKGSYVLVDDSAAADAGEGSATVTAADEAELLKEEEVQLSAKQYEKDGFLGGVDELQELLSEDVPVTPTRFFQLFVGNENTFEKDYHEARGDTDVKVTPWNPHEKFGTTRNVFYTLKLSGPIGPPTTRTEELHRYHLQMDRLIIDTSMNMLDAPYGDYFRVESQWIITMRDDQKSSNVKISAKAVFSKSTIMKGTISSRTLSGMTESFKFWLSKARDLLNQKQSALTAGGSSPSKGGQSAASAAPAASISSSPSTSSSSSAGGGARGGGGGGLMAFAPQLTLTNVLLMMNLVVNSLLVYALFRVINKL